MNKEERHEELEQRMQMFDGWLKEGKIPTSSKVIPVHQSLVGLQWVLPTQQVFEILRNSRSFALANCWCRSKYKLCNKPLEVCFYINDFADKMMAQGAARQVDLEEAAGILKLANEHGLIHLTIYNPEQHVYALCSCCDCCCHDIYFMQKLGRPDLVAHADYIASVDKITCVECGKCADRCIFGAQVILNDGVSFDQGRCFGCGLCMSSCPSNSIQMVRRTGG